MSEIGEGGQKVQASHFKINKSKYVLYSMMTIVSDNLLHIWKLLIEQI